MNNIDSYRLKFKDISKYSGKIGSGFQSTVDLNILTGIPKIQSPDLNKNRNYYYGDRQYR